jgi:glyoxylase-like metal-dependent hydrolase (beta-lactamase superfamily II)/rhodanese-related sulfurtransferase
MKRWRLILSLCILGLVICFPHILASGRQNLSHNPGYKILTSEDLLKKIDSGKILYLIDCRPPDEFNAGHIPRAVNVSMDSLGFDRDTALKKSMAEIQEDEGRELRFVLIDAEDGEEYMPRSKLEELLVHLPLNKDHEVIFYCRRPSCTRSPLAARWALSLGYTNVSRYEGGWQEWSEKRLPVEHFEGMGSPKVFRLGEHVFGVEGLYHSKGPLAGVNAGIILTANSAVFVDSGMSIASAEYLWRLAQKKMSGQKKIYLILTHSHSDHVFGMQFFREKGAEVIGHRLTAEHLKDDKGRYFRFIIEMDKITPEEGMKRYGHVVLSEPDRYIEQDTCLTIDGEEIRIFVTPGHTPDSICIYHPRSKTLFAGDSVYEGMDPTTRFGGPKEWNEWISHLERLRNLDIQAVVPGHGKISGIWILDQNISFLKQKIEEKRIPLQGDGDVLIRAEPQARSHFVIPDAVILGEGNVSILMVPAMNSFIFSWLF